MTASTDSSAAANVTEQLLELERRRGAAIVANDMDTLRTLLSPRLMHMHARGNIDTLESYLAFVSGRLQVLKVERSDMKVELHGACAVMVGRQVNTSRLRESPAEEPPVRVESMVTQVWVCEDGRWQQVSFQATPLGAPPPAVAR